MTRSSAIILVAAFALSCLLLAPQYRSGLNLSDEGLIWEGARLAGQRAYDANAFGHYSSRYITDNLILLIGNRNLLSLRVAWTILRILTALLIARLALAYAGPLAMILALLPFAFAPGPIHKAFIPFSEMLILTILLWRAPNRPTQKAALLVIISAVVTAMHPYTGVPLLAASILYFIIRKHRFGSTIWPLIGIYLAVLPFAGPWIIINDWSVFFRRHFLLMGSDFLGPRDLLLALFMGFRVPGSAGVAEALLIDVFILSIVAAVIVIIKNKDAEQTRRILTAAGLVALAGVPKMLARADGAHYLQNAAPFYLLFAVSFDHGVMRAKNKKLSCQFIISAVCCLFLLTTSALFISSTDYYVGSVGPLFRESKTLNISGARFTDHERKINETEKVVEAIQKLTLDADPIFVAPFAPGLYRLSGRRNPLPLALFDRPEDLTGFSENRILTAFGKDTPKLFKAYVEDAPKLVILEDFTADGKEANKFENVAPLLHAWIMENYAFHQRIGAFTIYTPTGKEE